AAIDDPGHEPPSPVGPALVGLYFSLQDCIKRLGINVDRHSNGLFRCSIQRYVPPSTAAEPLPQHAGTPERSLPGLLLVGAGIDEPGAMPAQEITVHQIELGQAPATANTSISTGISTSSISTTSIGLGSHPAML